jgi:16S rRNA (guanine527-N7)-methyltransferase
VAGVEPADLADLVANAGIELDARAIAKLGGYRDLLKRWNAVTNLVSRQDIDRLERRHLLDALSIKPWIHGSRIADLGSGGGLPGIPLAIALPTATLTLVERRQRKARFLNQVRMDLDLSNVTVIAGDYREVSGPFDTVVSRAVAGVTQVWAVVEKTLVAGGKLIVMSSTQGEDDHPMVLPNAASIVSQAIEIPGNSSAHGIVVVTRQEDGR